MRTPACLFIILLLIAFNQPGCKQLNRVDSTRPVVINASFNVRYEEGQYALQALTRDFERENPSVRVNLNFVRREEQYTSILSGSRTTESLDVACIDSIWIAELASKKLILPINAFMSPASLNDIHPAIRENLTWRGKLWAMPFRCYFQVLYYNAGLLQKGGFSKPPGTLEEWERQMEVLKEHRIVNFPLIDAWSQQECVVCDYVWMTGAYGGALFDGKGWPNFNRGPGLQALETMVRWVKRGLVHSLSLASVEQTTENTFLQGHAAYTTDWITQTEFINNPKYSRVSNDAKVALIPVSESIYRKGAINSSSVSGFQGIGIMRQSRHPALAWSYIRKIASPENCRYFKEAFPIWLSVQNSNEWKSIDPLCELKQLELSSVHHRPALKNYDYTSRVLQKYLHLSLEQKLSPQEAMDKAVQEITQSKLPF
jgi:multiple sugar transport system substrate-binding protein